MAVRSLGRPNWRSTRSAAVTGQEIVADEAAQPLVRGGEHASIDEAHLEVLIRECALEKGACVRRRIDLGLREPGRGTGEAPAIEMRRGGLQRRRLEDTAQGEMVLDRFCRERPTVQCELWFVNERSSCRRLETSSPRYG